MCIAIVTKPGARVDNKALYAGWTANSHGGGYCYVADGKVVIKKGFLSYNEFQKAYDADFETYGAISPFLIHMRIASSGAINEANTHPFSIRGGAMIHNGIMFTPSGKQAGEGKDTKSDTRVFAETLHNILHPLDIKAAERDILDAVGIGNKICFLYDNGEYVILNERSGTWVDGVWYSNGSCRVYARSTQTGALTPSAK